MRLTYSPYTPLASTWPATGRGILASFDDQCVVVYQAYRPEIGRYAAEHGRFGGAFSFTRMSWVKPNFLWMMYRCGWATKPDQETVLAVHLRRDFFELLLGATAPTSWDAHTYDSRADWQDALARTDVQVQWDPDHDPAGRPLERRAIQLGLRREVLRVYGHEAIAEIDDITEFVVEQREAARAGDWDSLLVPAERPFPVADADAARRLRLDW